MKIEHIRKLKITHYCGGFVPQFGKFPEEKDLTKWSEDWGVRAPGVTFHCNDCGVAVKVCATEDDDFIVIDKKEFEQFMKERNDK